MESPPEFLKEVMEDTDRGARELAIFSVQALSQFSEGFEGDTGSYPSAFEEVTKALAKIRPSMRVLENVAYRANSRMRQTIGEGGSPSDVAEDLLELADMAERAVERIAEESRDILRDKTVFTHSRSSTVLETLIRLKDEVRSVIVAESLPGGEGKVMADELSSHGLVVSLVPDSHSCFAMRRTDVVVLGADTIYSDGTLVNKVGSQAVALCARENDLPVYVFSDTLKVVPHSPETPRESSIERADKDETHYKGDIVLFEKVDFRLIDAYVTEDGIKEPPFAFLKMSPRGQ